MDIEEALYRVENEIEADCLDTGDMDERREIDLKKLPEAMVLVKNCVAESVALKDEIRALKSELSKEKEQWRLYFKQ